MTSAAPFAVAPHRRALRALPALHDSLCSLMVDDRYSPVAAQCLKAAVIGGFRFFGKKAPGNAFAVIPMMRNTFAAFAVPGTVIRAGTGADVVTTHTHSPNDTGLQRPVRKSRARPQHKGHRFTKAGQVSGRVCTPRLTCPDLCHAKNPEGGTCSKRALPDTASELRLDGRPGSAQAAGKERTAARTGQFPGARAASNRFSVLQRPLQSGCRSRIS